MIANFLLLMHQPLDNVELNEKTFRDRGSGFNYRIIWDNKSITRAWRDKLKKIYL